MSTLNCDYITFILDLASSPVNFPLATPPATQNYSTCVQSSSCTDTPTDMTTDTTDSETYTSSSTNCHKVKLSKIKLKEVVQAPDTTHQTLSSTLDFSFKLFQTLCEEIGATQPYQHCVEFADQVVLQLRNGRGSLIPLRKLAQQTNPHRPAMLCVVSRKKNTSTSAVEGSPTMVWQKNSLIDHMTSLDSRLSRVETTLNNRPDIPDASIVYTSAEDLKKLEKNIRGIESIFNAFPEANWEGEIMNHPLW